MTPIALFAALIGCTETSKINCEDTAVNIGGRPACNPSAEKQPSASSSTDTVIVSAPAHTSQRLHSLEKGLFQRTITHIQYPPIDK